MATTKPKFEGLPYLPHSKIDDTTPHIIVDGGARVNASCVLALTHSPGNNVPQEMKADSSTQIAFNYLHNEKYLQLLLDSKAKGVSNDHCDIDGITGVFVIHNPTVALKHHKLLEEVAAAGDFVKTKDPTAAKITFTILAYMTQELSPLDKSLFDSPDYITQSDKLYEAILPLLPDMLQNIEKYKIHWEKEYTTWQKSEALVSQGLVKIEDDRLYDITIVTFSDSEIQPDECHQMAIHNNTQCHTTIIIQPKPKKYQFNYRYETQVDFQSSKVTKRKDLDPLAKLLTNMETERGSKNVEWENDVSKSWSPWVRNRGGPSHLTPQEFIEQVKKFVGPLP